MNDICRGIVIYYRYDAAKFNGTRLRIVRPQYIIIARIVISRFNRAKGEADCERRLDGHSSHFNLSFIDFADRN